MFARSGPIFSLKLKIHSIFIKVFLALVKIYLCKVTNGNTSKSCKTNSKLIISTPEQPHLRCCVVFNVNFEHILQLFSGVFITKD